MTMRRGQGRRRAAATAISIAGHGLVIGFLAMELDEPDALRAPTPSVQVTLTTDLSPRASASTRAAPTAAHTPAPTESAQSTSPTASNSRPAVAAGPAAQAGSTDQPSGAAEPAKGPLAAGCIGRWKTSRAEEVDCKLEIWSRGAKRDLNINGVDSIPEDKREAYAAVARRQANRREPVSRLGNHSSMNCAQANLGVGCVEEMLIPLIGSGARER